MITTEKTRCQERESERERKRECCERDLYVRNFIKPFTLNGKGVKECRRKREREREREREGERKKKKKRK